MSDLLAAIAAPQVPVMSRFAKGWPLHAEHFGNLITYRDLAEALTADHATDAHFAAYSVPDVARRLGGDGVFEALDGRPVTMALFLLDVEPAGHAPVTPEWWTAEQAKLARLLADHPGGFVYRTRGGYRVVYELAEPVLLRDAGDAERWKRTYTAWLAAVLERYQIAADGSCKDWTRLYRLPRVVRDGEPQTPETFGDASLVGSWAMTVEIAEVEAPAPAVPSVLGTESPALLAHVAERLRELGPAIEGQGGDALTFRAAAIASHDFDLGEASAWACLAAWNASCVPPWAEIDLREKMANAAAYAKGVRGDARAAFEDGEVLAETLGLAETVVVAAPEDYPGGVLEVLGAIVREADAPAPGTFAAEIARALGEVRAALGTARDSSAEIAPLFERATDLIARSFPEDPWLVRPLVKRGGTLVVSGEPKTGKSWVLTEIAIAIASGTLAFGRFATGAPRRVAYFYAEDLGADVRAHLLALAAGRGMAPDRALANLLVQRRGRFLDVLRDDDLALIVASIRKLGGVDLLCLEPLRDLHGGEEDKSDSMRDVMRRLRLLGELLSCTIAAAHHAAKSGNDVKGRRGGQKMRGSGAIHGAIDSGIYLSGLSGNGETEFVNDVESEVKGARGGGSFALALRIEDGPDNRAIKAAWTVDKPDPTVKPMKTRDDLDEAAVLAFVRACRDGGSAPPNATQIRGGIPDPAGAKGATVPDKRARAAITRLVDKGRLRVGQASDPRTKRTLQGDRYELVGDQPAEPASAPDPALAGVAKLRSR